MGAKDKKRHKLSVFLKRILVTINIIVAILTLLSAYGGYIDPRTWILPAFCVLAFPIMLATLVIISLVDLLLSPKVSIISGIALLLCLPSAINLCPLNIPYKSKESVRADEFTLMTYNVFSFVNNDTLNRKSEMPSLECIQRLHPDIVCLQEGKPFIDKGLKKKYPEIMDSLSSMYPYYINNEGNLILSKWQLEPVPTGIEKEDSFSATCAKLEVEGHTLYIFNLHLQSIGLTPDDKELFRELRRMEATKSTIKTARIELGGKLAYAFRKRAAQAEKVRHFLDSLKGNVVVCGDFNDVPGCYAIRTIRGGDLRDAYFDTAFGTTVTYNNNKLFFRIDHILYKGDLEAVNTVRDNNRGSDHYPLMTTFKWTKN